MADELFDAVRHAFPIGTWVEMDVRRPDELLANPSVRDRHLTVHVVLCVQRLRLLGSSADAFDHDEAFVLLSSVNMLLQRLLDGAANETPAIRRLHEVHGRVIPHAMALDQILLDDSVEPEGS